MATDIEIQNAFLEALGRMPSAEETNQFLNASNYAMTTYIRGRPEYGASNIYQTRYSQIQSLGQDMFGHQIDPGYVDQLIRADVSDDQILFGWRNSNYYRQTYPDKPTWMSEAEYRTNVNKMEMERGDVNRLFSRFGGRQLSDAELRRIYVGGGGANELRREYARYQRLQTSYDAARGKQIATKIKETPLGPVQPAMAGIQDVVGSPNDILQNGDIFKQSYQDFKENGGVQPTTGRVSAKI